MAIYNTKTGEKKHVGLILHVRGTFRMDTSMDEVLIWNPETRTTSIEYLCGNDWFADKDASAEVIADYYKAIQDRQSHLDKLNAEAKLKSVVVGSTVKVVRGRKIPKGTVFTVARIEDFGYGEVLFLNDGTYTYLKNVHILYKDSFIEPETYIEYTFYFQAV